MRNPTNLTEIKSMKLVRRHILDTSKGYAKEEIEYSRGSVFHSVNGEYHSTTGPAQPGPNGGFWVHGYPVSQQQMARWIKLCAHNGLDPDDPASVYHFKPATDFEGLGQLIDRLGGDL